MTPGAKNNFQYITFRLAQSLMGVDILDIREIIPCTRITRVQCAPGFVTGLINLRGQILTILDISVLMGFEKTGQPGSHIIVFKHRNVGFVVDQIGDLFDVERSRIESIPVNVDPKIKKYSDTIVNLDDNVLMIINAGKIIACNRTETRYLKEAQ